MDKEPHLPCPLPGCGRRFRSYAAMGRHTKAKHALCIDCALRGEEQCLCREKALADQADHGLHHRVNYTDAAGNRRSVIITEMANTGGPAPMVTGLVASPNGSVGHTEGDTYVTRQIFIHQSMVTKVTPLAFNTITGLLEKSLLPAAEDPPSA